jgi:hypothetical protein
MRREGMPQGLHGHDRDRDGAQPPRAVISSAVAKCGRLMLLALMSDASSTRSLLGTVVALVIMATSALAGSLTEIRGADDSQRLLPVYLARPAGAGPFPAVVVLHGCSGFSNVAVTWADRLASWG